MNPSAIQASEHFKESRLTEAIAAATAAVKADPSDPASRILFCELLCFAGDLERADKQLDTLSQLDPQLAVIVASFRTVLRGAQAFTGNSSRLAACLNSCLRRRRNSSFGCEASILLRAEGNLPMRPSCSVRTGGRSTSVRRHSATESRLTTSATWTI